jgi:hypothetical protein
LLLSLSSRPCWVYWSLWELKPKNDRKIYIICVKVFFICSHSSLTDLKVSGSGEELKYVFCVWYSFFIVRCIKPWHLKNGTSKWQSVIPVHCDKKQISVRNTPS